MKKPDKKPNYITVSAAIKELEKIEMVRQLDNIYCLDHAVTANQKVILKAFGLNANSIKYFASELSKELKKAEADVIAAKKKYGVVDNTSCIFQDILLILIIYKLYPGIVLRF